jgi:5-methyltetrahydrofolate--homocysteine methyltransferase
MTTLTAPNGTLEFGPGMPTALINDQLRVMDQAADVLDELRQGRFDHLLALARRGQAVGTTMVDILINHVDLDEAALLPRIAAAVQETVGCPIALDTRNPAALDAALHALKPCKPLVNSITAEREVIDPLLPIIKRHGAAVVVMPIGHEHGVPKTVDGRMSELHAILTATDAAGIPREDIVVDTICLASAAEPGSMQVTLETTRAVSEMGIATVLGIGNAGYGMPDQTVIDLAYLVAAIPWGLDAALVDPETAGLVQTVRAVDFLVGNDPYGLGYIEYYRAQQAAQSSTQTGEA